MAQPKLDRLLIDVASAVGDSVATAGAAGKIYSGADRLTAINKAREAVYDAYIESLQGIDNFIATFPEWVKVVTTFTLSPKPGYVKKILKMHHTNGGTQVIINPLPPEMYLDALYNSTYSSWGATAAEWYFMEHKNNVDTEIVTILTNTGLYGGASVTTGQVVLQPVDALHDTISGGTNDDIPDPVIWHERTVKAAVDKLQNEMQVQ